MLKKITANMYVAAAAIFFIVSCAAYINANSFSILIGGVTMALLCLAFQYLFKVEWDSNARTHLLKSCEELKSFGDALPLKIIGKLSMVWIVLLILTFIKPLATALVPGIPVVIFTVVSNLSFAMFIIATFYQILSGNFKGISLSTEIFAIYNIIDVIYEFIFGGKVLSIKAMSLFLAFWSIHLIFGTMLKESDPNSEEPTKKDKKKNKKEESKEDTKEESKEE